MPADPYNAQASQRIRAYLTVYRRRRPDQHIVHQWLADGVQLSILDLERVATAAAEAEQLREQLAQARAEIENLRPGATAHEQCTRAIAEREYHNGTCDSCYCCTTAQCAEHRCQTNSIGESICPCTCD